MLKAPDVTSPSLFAEEEWELEFEELPEVPPHFLDEIVSPAPAGLRDRLWLAPEEIELYYSVVAPQLVRVGDELRGPCPFDACLGTIRIPLEQGYFEVVGGCREQGSIYGFEMRVRNLSFYEALQRVRRWVQRPRPVLNEKNVKKRRIS